MNTYEETMRRVNAACDGIAATLDKIQAERAADGELCGYVDDETGHVCERKATRRRFMRDGVCGEHGELIDREERESEDSCQEG